MYVVAVSIALGVAGTAIGFAVGVVPYFRANFDLQRYDWFFLSSMLGCAALGFLVGAIFGARWYRASETSPLLQRRMLAYMQRHADEELGIAGVRSLNPISLRSLLGSKRKK